jgi:ADP-ribose pyrophosphatase YjhB (NUDIX family)
VRTARAVSAGGVVLAELRLDAAVALVARRSARGTLQWTLPKGQQETGESVPETALREVREETGLEVELVGPLDTIDYWFVWAPEQTRYHKFVHYFLMRATGGDLTRHDQESEEAAWFSLDRAHAVMAFPNERRLLDLIPDALRAARDRGPAGDGQWSGSPPVNRGSGGLKERSGSPPGDEGDAGG